MFGMICKNEEGKIGIVLHVFYRPDLWTGIGVRGGYWKSRKPVVLAKNIEEYVKLALKKQRDKCAES